MDKYLCIIIVCLLVSNIVSIVTFFMFIWHCKVIDKMSTNIDYIADFKLQKIHNDLDYISKSQPEIKKEIRKINKWLREEDDGLHGSSDIHSDQRDSTQKTS